MTSASSFDCALLTHLQNQSINPITTFNFLCGKEDSTDVCMNSTGQRSVDHNSRQAPDDHNNQGRHSIPTDRSSRDNNIPSSRQPSLFSRSVAETVTTYVITTETSSRSYDSVIYTSSKKRYIFLRVIVLCIATIMNAAITIFGMGIGVGLILGDSFPSGGSSRSTTNGVAMNNTNVDDHTNPSNPTGTSVARDREEEIVVVSAGTPTCRATIRRTTRNRMVQEGPSLSAATMSTMPAQ